MARHFYLVALKSCLSSSEASLDNIGAAPHPRVPYWAQTMWCHKMLWNCSQKRCQSVEMRSRPRWKCIRDQGSILIWAGQCFCKIPEVASTFCLLYSLLCFGKDWQQALKERFSMEKSLYFIFLCWAVWRRWRANPCSHIRLFAATCHQHLLSSSWRRTSCNLLSSRPPFSFFKILSKRVARRGRGDGRNLLLWIPPTESCVLE